MRGIFAMKLYFKDIHLGDISNANGDGFWMYGNINFTNNISDFKEFLNKMVDENNPPLDDVNPILLDESNWFVAKNNHLEGIGIPAIYFDSNEIEWRWR